MRASLFAALLLLAEGAAAQSPELAMRELASGQVKKGVRAIGFGGDGATWGNYSLVWRDASSALFDAGETSYSNGNSFAFFAAGATTPALWRGLSLYALGLTQYADGVSVPSLGKQGSGRDNALFVKAALPLPRGFSVGVLLSYERSRFDFAGLHYRTDWLPSGGLGVAWQPHQRVLLGVRALFNHDWEHRVDDGGERQGLARSYELRTGISVALWKGALVDVGGTLLDRSNAIAGTHTLKPEPNLGFEQALWDRRLVARFGLDESTIGGGVSVKFAPLSLDVAYLHNLGFARIGPLFGGQSDSVIATLNLDYAVFQSGNRER